MRVEGEGRRFLGCVASLALYSRNQQSALCAPGAIYTPRRSQAMRKRLINCLDSTTLSNTFVRQRLGKLMPHNRRHTGQR